MACAQGTVSLLPVKNKTVQIKRRDLTYVYLRCNGKTAIHQRSAGDIWQGLWEPPTFEGGQLPQWQGRLTLLKDNVRHVLTHRRIIATFYLLETDTPPATLPSDYVWIDENEIDRYALPRLVEKLIETLSTHTAQTDC